MKKEIREFICHELLLDESADLADEENLLVTGILDSLALMRLVMHLEETHDIEIPPQEITLENFGSVAAMAAFLEDRLENRAA